MEEPHTVPATLESGRQRLGGVAQDVDEGHARALRRKRLDDELADAAATAGDQHATVLQRRVLRVPTSSRVLIQRDAHDNR